eukprot:GHVO01050538.1.p1 GENE.GHVO01050538.1~~GHVO01050538.1.p1  ORF type:complete len:152 (-),score=38.20 GHVO01050538.1:66-521(-)
MKKMTDYRHIQGLSMEHNRRRVRMKRAESIKARENAVARTTEKVHRIQASKVQKPNFLLMRRRVSDVPDEAILDDMSYAIGQAMEYKQTVMDDIQAYRDHQAELEIEYQNLEVKLKASQASLSSASSKFTEGKKAYRRALKENVAIAAKPA